MDRNRVVTITELNLWTALTQADGFRRSENPLFQRGPALLVLVRLPLPWLLLRAMCLPVVGVFGCLIAPLWVVRPRKHFCRQPLLPAFD